MDIFILAKLTVMKQRQNGKDARRRNDFRLEFVLGGAGEHAVLSDHQSLLIAPIAKIFPRIVPAAPHADKVVIGSLAGLQRPQCHLRRDPGQDMILRYPVAPPWQTL